MLPGSVIKKLFNICVTLFSVQLQAFQLQQLMSAGSLGAAAQFGMPQLPAQAPPPSRSTKRQNSTGHSNLERTKYEESVLANAILSTEKHKRETQQRKLTPCPTISLACSSSVYY